MCKAKWRASKVKNDPEYIEKVWRYDRDRKRNHTSRNYSTSCEDHTSWTNSELDLPCTPVKCSPPSYYKVLSTSKQVQHLLGPSPNTHTTILKHVLNKAIKSPRKNKYMGEFTSPPKNSVMPPKQSLGKLLQRIAVLRSQKKLKEVQELARSLKSEHTISQIAGYSGETTQAVYRLLSCGKKRRLKKEYVKKLTCFDKEEVIKIYNDDKVTYSLPDMKYAGLRFMHFTIREAYGVYLKKCKLKRIVAEKTFKALKPKFVRTVQETPLHGTRCEYCANFAKTDGIFFFF